MQSLDKMKKKNGSSKVQREKFRDGGRNFEEAQYLTKPA